MPQELNPNVQFRHLIGDLSEVIDEAILHALEGSHPDDALLAALAEARGGIVRVNHAMKVVTINMTSESHNDTLPDGAQPKALPKVKPLPSGKYGKPTAWEKERPGIAKKLRSPQSYDCPACGAEAGTHCFRFDAPGKSGKPTDQRNTGTTYHTARQALSVAHNDKVRRDYDRAMSKAHEPNEKGTPE